MKKFIFLFVVAALLLAGGAVAQDASTGSHESQGASRDSQAPQQDASSEKRSGSAAANPQSGQEDEPKQTNLQDVPHDDEAAPPPGENDSSSNSTKVGLAPPPGEADFRTGSGAVDTHVNELKPWNPHKSDKDVEVGNFYYKRQNYGAAESRYREALYWMDNNAIASFALAQTLEKLGRNQEAVKYYKEYLSILPDGPEAKSAHKGIEKLANKPDEPTKAAQQQFKLPEEIR